MTIASLPIHKYVWIERSFIRKNGKGLEPAVWFGIVSIPGRVWGLNVMLECGAVYRNLPPHAISFNPQKVCPWGVAMSQTWDCYGERFAVHEYTYLSGLRAQCLLGDGKEYSGDYMFTVCPIGDGFSRQPDQAKEFMFVALDNGRLTIQPTNRVLFSDRSFTNGQGWPKDLKPNLNIYSCEFFFGSGSHPRFLPQAP